MFLPKIRSVRIHTASRHHVHHGLEYSQRKDLSCAVVLVHLLIYSFGKIAFEPLEEMRPRSFVTITFINFQVLALIWRFATFFLRHSLPFNRFVFNFTSMSKINEEHLRIVMNRVSFGEWIFLSYLAGSMNSKLFDDLLSQLAESYNEKIFTSDEKLAELEETKRPLVEFKWDRMIWNTIYENLLIDFRFSPKHQHSSLYQNETYFDVNCEVNTINNRQDSCNSFVVLHQGSK